MIQLKHGFRILDEHCRGCLSCMRACPTHAIRVKDGKARYRAGNCIDCGQCLKACPHSAITATTWPLEHLDRYKFKVALPSPVLFGQFPTGITSTHIADGLRTIGFDAVRDYSVEVGMVSRATADYVANWNGAFPLITVTCPVVVRLVQVSYPRMVEQLIHVQLPRELAARELKRRFAAELGLAAGDIAAIYITPCQAKTISILQPAEEVESHLDGALAISGVYNAIVAYANTRKNDGGGAEEPFLHSAFFLRWSAGEGLGDVTSRHGTLRVTGLANVIQVFDDIEKGRLRNVSVLDAYACWSGCLGGNLTVANVYVTSSKLQSLISRLPETDAETSAEIERRYPCEDCALARPIRPRPVQGSTGTLRERVRTMELAETLRAALPGLDCGLCGAPTCRDMARDISTGEASSRDCVFLSTDRLRRLQQLYLSTGHA